MKIITVPLDVTLYPDIVTRTIMDIRMKLGTSRIELNCRHILSQKESLLVIDFFNTRGKLYTLRYNLPPDTPERAERRVSRLLYLSHNKLNVIDDVAV